MTSDPSFDLRVADAITALTVSRHGAVTTAARELRVTASQVSKALARVERTVGVPMFTRRGRGLVLNDAGLRALPRLSAIVDNARALFERKESARIAIAAPSYLCQFYLGLVANAVAPRMLRGLEGMPTYVRTHAGEGLFSLALTTTEDRFPPAWDCARVGTVRFGVFGPPDVVKKLGKNPSVEATREVPFVTPIYANGAEVVAGDDRFPIPRSERQLSHEASTIFAALGLAADTGSLVCGPAIAAAHWTARGALREVSFSDWSVDDPLFLYFDTDAITQQTKTRIVDAFAAQAKRS